MLFVILFSVSCSVSFFLGIVGYLFIFISTLRERLYLSAVGFEELRTQFETLLCLGKAAVFLWTNDHNPTDPSVPHNNSHVSCAIYSQLTLSRLRLSRIIAYLEEKIWSLF